MLHIEKALIEKERRRWNGSERKKEMAMESAFVVVVIFLCFVGSQLGVD